MDNKFRQAFEAVLQSFRDALQDGKITLPEFMRILFRIQQAALAITQSLHQPTDEDRKIAIEAWEDVFDRHIKPLDIPWIPNLAEKLIVDPLIRKAGTELLEELFDSLTD